MDPRQPIPLNGPMGLVRIVSQDYPRPLVIHHHHDCPRYVVHLDPRTHRTVVSPHYATSFPFVDILRFSLSGSPNIPSSFCLDTRFLHSFPDPYFPIRCAELLIEDPTRTPICHARIRPSNSCTRGKLFRRRYADTSHTHRWYTQRPVLAFVPAHDLTSVPRYADRNAAPAINAEQVSHQPTYDQPCSNIFVAYAPCRAHSSRSLGTCNPRSSSSKRRRGVSAYGLSSLKSALPIPHWAIYQNVPQNAVAVAASTSQSTSTGVVAKKGGNEKPTRRNGYSSAKDDILGNNASAKARSRFLYLKRRALTDNTHAGCLEESEEHEAEGECQICAFEG